MSVLEILAEKHLGADSLKKHPKLVEGFARIERSAAIEESEKERIEAIGELLYEYRRETDPEEQRNILRTLVEITMNEPLELPKETVDEWDARLKGSDANYAKIDEAAVRKTEAFLRKYFSLRAKAGLTTQANVARASGLSRSYVAVIETGEHVPQQKTIQKLAKAFGVDVSDLL